MAAALTKEQIAEFREIFSFVDRDNSGHITADELCELMTILQIDTSSEEVSDMIAELDQDGNDAIDFQEFVSVMSRKVHASYTADQVKAAFEAFDLGDAGKKGHISVEKLLKALTTHGTTVLSLEEATELVNQLEPDPSGLINYEDYVHMIMHD